MTSVVSAALHCPSGNLGSEPGPADQIACDLIVDDEPGSGAWNMAADAALLQLAANSDSSVFRIYSWREPTVTIGYFQQAAAIRDQVPGSLPVVRRLTGGGAILHDREMTYSCVLPVCHPRHRHPYAVYGLIHGAIAGLLRDCGVPCWLRSTCAPERPSGVDHPEAANDIRVARGLAPDEPFFCFLRHDPNDIVCQPGGTGTPALKIVGSAQRRRRGTVLQHGSILLRGSAWTPQIPGIVELHPEFDEQRFFVELPERTARVLSTAVRRRNYSEEEKKITEVLCKVSGNIG